MTAQTPVYGLKYLVQGEPVRNTRQALEDNAKTIEAALILRGVPAPTAPDLATAVGRISALEGLPPVAVPFIDLNGNPTMWSKFSAGWRTLRTWRQGRTVYMTGVIKNANALTVTNGSIVGRLPVGYRPTVETEMFAGLAQANLPFRLDITVDGIVTLTNNGTATIPVGAFCTANAFWSVD